jgi:presequence protease
VTDTFEFLGEHPVESLNLTLQSFQHKVTGARHYHMRTEDDNNAFLVAFLTVPNDSTGVAHILEHTSLCGSQRFPVRDPFFGMLKRSLQTFMNAFTASDWTAYPFATRNAKDFDNLLQVYLDAAFFPKLTALDFAQEGHRLEFEDANAEDSALIIKGVVYNEMKGAMGPPVSQVHQTLMSNLFPTITYHYNSGGDPDDIPELTHQRLRDFHARHYHPSNAVFMTYGDLPVAQHHERFEGLALSQFSDRHPPLRVTDEQRYAAPQIVEAEFAIDGDEQPDETHVVLGWLLGNSNDLDFALRAHLLSSILLEHSGSPLRAALETAGLGAAPSELCGLDDNSREAVFTAGLEGTSPQHADAIEALIMGVLENIAEHGIDAQAIESCLHQLELGQREVGGDHFPYGLNLMLRALGAALHGAEPASMLDIDGALTELAAQAREPSFIKKLVREMLLDNPHRVRLTMRPNASLTQDREQRLRDALEAKRQQMSAADKQAIRAQASALEALQDAPDDSHLLPCVTLSDIPTDISIPVPEDIEANTVPVARFAERTNGLVYAQLAIDVPALEATLSARLPLFSDLLTEVGCAEHDYMTQQARQSAYTGGLSASVGARTSIDDPNTDRHMFTLRGKALARNTDAMTDMLVRTLAQARFDESDRLVELIAQMRAQDESRITDIGHQLALMAAADGMTPVSSLNEQSSGLTAIADHKALDAQLHSRTGTDYLRAHFEALQQALLSAPRRVAVVSERAHAVDATTAITEALKHLPPISSKAARTAAGNGFAPTNLAWVVNSPVSFCAKVFRAPAQGHADTPALMVLAQLLRSNFLHKEIREKGGAYGGGASYDASTATFGFYSYRDPQLAATLDTFDASLAWAEQAATDQDMRDAAILSVIGAIDRPGSPAGEAVNAFHNRLHGRGADFLRSLRLSLLAVDTEALRRAIATHLRPDLGRVAVVTNARMLEQQAGAYAFEAREL